MEHQFDSLTQGALDTVYQGTAKYLEVLANTSSTAMALVDAHDDFCRKILQDKNVLQLFWSFGRLGLAGILSSREPSLMANYERLVQDRMALMCIATPHKELMKTILLVGTVRTAVEVLRVSQLPQIEELMGA